MAIAKVLKIQAMNMHGTTYQVVVQHPNGKFYKCVLPAMFEHMPSQATVLQYFNIDDKVDDLANWIEVDDIREELRIRY